MTGFETVVISVVAAIIYSLSFYLKKQGQEFSWSKFISTGLTGLIVGLFALMTNSPVTETSVIMQLGVFSGVTAVIESLVKAVIRRLFPQE